jgi:hypothetical protein
VLAWDDFWDLIDLLGGRADPDACDRLAQVLATRSKAVVIGFADRLAEALYRIDRADLAAFPHLDVTDEDGLPLPLSDDAFLYARCGVVAAGREAYARVLADPAAFCPYTSREYDGEALLYVAEDAWEALTGRPWEHVEPFDDESGANAEGWAPAGR